MLRRAVPIRATTLAEAVAEAERNKAAESVLVAMNSLWVWLNNLPDKEREAMGTFKNARDLWMTARFRSQLQ